MEQQGLGLGLGLGLSLEQRQEALGAEALTPGGSAARYSLFLDEAPEFRGPAVDREIFVVFNLEPEAANPGQERRQVSLAGPRLEPEAEPVAAGTVYYLSSVQPGPDKPRARVGPAGRAEAGEAEPPPPPPPPGPGLLLDTPAVLGNIENLPGASASPGGLAAATLGLISRDLLLRLENGVLLLATPEVGAGGPVKPEEEPAAQAFSYPNGPAPAPPSAACGDSGVRPLPADEQTQASPSPSGPEAGGLGLEAGPGTGLLLSESGDVLLKLSEGLGLGLGLQQGQGPGPGPLHHCPEQNCQQAFDKKQRLRVHLLSHSQRPFRCTVAGCEWSFTTAYKLKRHLHSHGKLRPFGCQAERCGKRFTTVYNLKAHMKAHVQELAFACDVCSQPFATALKLSSHRRCHFEPQRPFKCDFPDCEKTFITINALGSHNRSHLRDHEHFTCSFPGCDKHYDKACRLKIHLRSHTGERPFICDFNGCGWSFTCMSKLLRHKRAHEDDRRFVCPVDGCGKSFIRAEHLKGHSVTHLGTRPFVCPVEGCEARFSARSSLYIHSKKHLEDTDKVKTRCPLSNCSKLFNSKSSIKFHMMKQHNINSDLLFQLELTGSLLPSSELASPSQSDLSNVDVTSLFTAVPTAPVNISPDISLVSSGILTIDASSVGSTLGSSVSVNNSAMAQGADPLIVATSDISHAMDGTLGLPTGILQQSTLNLEGVQPVTVEALGALSMRGAGSCQELRGLSSSGALSPSSSLGGSHVPELLTPSKVECHMLSVSDMMSQQEGSKVVTQYVFSNLNTPTSTFGVQKELELNMVSGCSFLESGGSARTDYRAIQLAKKRKQKGVGDNPESSSCANQRNKSSRGQATTSAAVSQTSHFGNIMMPVSSLTIRDLTTGAQYIQPQLLQDDPTGDGDLAFQLTAQSSTSQAQLTVDLLVNILQEPNPSAEDDGSSNSQFTGSTINLQDLE